MPNQKMAVILAGAVALQTCAVAFYRAGAEGLVTIGTLSCLSSVLLFNAIKSSPTRKGALFLAICVCLVVFSLAVFPEIVNSDFKAIRERDSQIRRMRAEISELLVNQGLSDVQFHYHHLRTHGVEFFGEMENEIEFKQFRQQLLSNCPELSPRFLHWDIRDREGLPIADGLDSSIFHEEEEKGGRPQ